VSGVVPEGGPKQADTPAARWLLLKVGCGRVGRWAAFSVALAAVPILISFLALPRSSSMTSLLSHGDFAILASALVAASVGELLGPDEPQRGIRNILIAACFMLFAFTIVLLAGIANNSSQLSPRADVKYSWLSFLVAVVIGAASWGLTVHRSSAHARGGIPEKEGNE